mgnify:CR=1 FL=1
MTDEIIFNGSKSDFTFQINDTIKGFLLSEMLRVRDRSYLIALDRELSFQLCKPFRFRPNEVITLSIIPIEPVKEKSVVIKMCI